MRTFTKHEKQAARAAVGKAIRRGELVRPEHCSHCHTESYVHAHHDDYARPLDIQWLCSQCHRLFHPGERRQEAPPRRSPDDKRAHGVVFTELQWAWLMTTRDGASQELRRLVNKAMASDRRMGREFAVERALRSSGVTIDKRRAGRMLRGAR